MFSTSLALLAQTFHGRERGVAFGVWGAVAAVATALGPLLGGLLTTGLSWHWIFYVNLPIGAVAILITLTRVEEFRPPHARRIDLAGFALFTVGLTALVYGLIESSRRGWGSGRVIGALVVAAVMLVAFPLAERVVREPMFDLIAVPQADLRRRFDRRLRDERVAVRDAALPRRLPPERACTSPRSGAAGGWR